jgi:general transcription factor 3C polypeptide 5 (transcription factor C subunit 1)
LERRLTADDNIKLSSWKLGKLIRRVGYYFLDGPWRSTYVKFGYDPRRDPDARRWQMLDFRQPSASGPFAERGRSQLHQLCELEDPVVKSIIERPPSVDIPHPQFGWINQEDLHSIRNQLKLKSTESLRRVLPQ